MLNPIPSLSTDERIKRSPNYRFGVFHNIHKTAVILEGVSFLSMLRDFFTKPSTCEPSGSIPVLVRDLVPESPDQPEITWFGHSSYLIQYKGKNILVDPVLSGRASPVPFFVNSFKGSDHYKPKHLPNIDLLLISHNHYDHLDKITVKELQPKVKQVICPLGVAKNLEEFGYRKEQVKELDWWEYIDSEAGAKIIATPARHFSGRGTKRNGSLWCSYVLQLENFKFFIGGDSGYDDQFKKIGDELGPFDIAILENGQYGKNWPHIHMMPEEVAQAALDLRAKVLMPVHWGKFALSNHPWTEPIERLIVAATGKSVNLTTPRIGEPVVPGTSLPVEHWWKECG